MQIQDSGKLWRVGGETECRNTLLPKEKLIIIRSPRVFIGFFIFAVGFNYDISSVIFCLPFLKKIVLISLVRNQAAENHQHICKTRVNGIHSPSQHGRVFGRRVLHLWVWSALTPYSSSHSAPQELVMVSTISLLSLTLKFAVPGGLEMRHTATQAQENYKIT